MMDRTPRQGELGRRTGDGHVILLAPYPEVMEVSVIWLAAAGSWQEPQAQIDWDAEPDPLLRMEAINGDPISYRLLGLRLDGMLLFERVSSAMSERGRA